MSASVTSDHSRQLPLGQRELVVLMAVLMSLNALCIDSMIPALDEMARSLGVASGNQRQLIVAVYTIAMGVGCLFPGAYADRFGRRPILLWSLGAYCVLNLAIAFITDFGLLLLVRAFVGLLGAGLSVTPRTIVRDLYDGDAMARLLSIISAVFITVPVLAPSFGQLVLTVGTWHWIFVCLSVFGAATFAWVWYRLPETLDERHKQEINLPIIGRNMKAALFNRTTFGYVIATMLVMGGVFGYLNSAQQLLGDHFHISQPVLPLVLGGTASIMIVANLANSSIVMRFGARRVSHAGVILFILVSAVQVWASYYRSGDLYLFIPLIACNLGLLAFLGSNFGSIALQPFAHIAGAASSVQTFFRMFGAALVGMVIGQVYDGTARPFAWAMLVSSIMALGFVIYSEEGHLFRRFNTTPPNRKVLP